MHLDLPQEGKYTGQNGLRGHLKDIQLLDKQNGTVFAARWNWSSRGKVWRLHLWLEREVRFADGRPSEYRWNPAGYVSKVDNWKGNWKVTFNWPLMGELWFKSEAEAEDFLISNWRFIHE